MEQLLAVGADLGLPELGEGEYLHELMAEVGPFRASSDQMLPTDWNIIAPFGDAIGLDPDDMTTLALMCRGFCTARCEGENPLAIPPVDRRTWGEGDNDGVR